MAAVDDIWEHAQNSRMWLQTAHDAATRAASGSAGSFILSYFTRGRSRRAAIAEAHDAIGKLRLAYLDLENAMHRAGQRPLPLRTLELVHATPRLVNRAAYLPGDLVRALVAALGADLAAVDSVIAEVEQLQRQARAPQQR